MGKEKPLAFEWTVSRAYSRADEVTPRNSPAAKNARSGTGSVQFNCQRDFKVGDQVRFRDKGEEWNYGKVAAIINGMPKMARPTESPANGRSLYFWVMSSLLSLHLSERLSHYRRRGRLVSV